MAGGTVSGVLDQRLRWYSNGSYKPDNDESASFVLVDGLTLYGAFAGTENVFVFDFDIGTRNFDSYETILSGDIGTVGTDGTDNCYHVVTGRRFIVMIIVMRQLRTAQLARIWQIVLAAG